MKIYMHKTSKRIAASIFAISVLFTPILLYDQTKLAFDILFFYFIFLLFIIFSIFFLSYYWKRIELNENNIIINYFMFRKVLNLYKIIGFKYMIGSVLYYKSPLLFNRIEVTKNICDELFKFNNKLKKVLTDRFKHNILKGNVEVRFKLIENYKVLFFVFIGLLMLIFSITSGMVFGFNWKVVLLAISMAICIITFIIFYLYPILNKLVYIFSNEKIIIIKKKKQIEIQFSDIKKISICRKYFTFFYSIETKNDHIYLKKNILDLYIGCREFLEEKYGKEINNEVIIKK